MVPSTASMHTVCIPVWLSSNSAPPVTSVRSLIVTPSIVKVAWTSSDASQERPCLWSKNEVSVPGLIDHSTIGAVVSRANAHDSITELLAQSLNSRVIKYSPSGSCDVSMLYWAGSVDWPGSSSSLGCGINWDVSHCTSSCGEFSAESLKHHSWMSTGIIAVTVPWVKLTGFAILSES